MADPEIEATRPQQLIAAGADTIYVIEHPLLAGFDPITHKEALELQGDPEAVAPDHEDEAIRDAVVEADTRPGQGPQDRRMGAQEPEHDHAEQRHRNGQHEDHRVDRLGDEEVGDSLDIRDDLATFAHHVWQSAKLAVDEHELSHGPGGGAAAADGDTDVGVLQSQHIVDSVTRHRHHVIGRLQRLDDLVALGRTRKAR